VKYADDFQAGLIPKFTRSQPVVSYNPPQYPNGQVTEIVGANFERFVLDPRVHTFLFSYMPSCGHCKSFAPTFDELAKRFAWRVHFYKMDGTQNDVDHPECNFKAGFPSVWFFAKGDKTTRATQLNPPNGDRSLKSTMLWLNDMLSNEVSPDETVEEVEEVADEDDDDEEDDDEEEFSPSHETEEEETKEEGDEDEEEEEKPKKKDTKGKKKDNPNEFIFEEAEVDADL